MLNLLRDPLHRRSLILPTHHSPRSGIDANLLRVSFASVSPRKNGEITNYSRPPESANQSYVFFIAPVTGRHDRKKPTPKHSDGFINSSGKGVRYDHRLCESFDKGAESQIGAC